MFRMHALRRKLAKTLIGGVSLVGLIGLAATGTAHAMSGETQRLPWPHAGETLRHTTCGCADSCWSAELRDTRTHQLKLRLQCASLQLQLTRPTRTPGMKAEPEVLGTCEAIHASPQKFDLIQDKLKSLRAR